MLKDKIVRYLNDKAAHPVRFRDLARAFNINRKKYGMLRIVLKDLVAEGRILHLKGRGYVTRGKPPRKSGRRYTVVEVSEDPEAEITELVREAGLSEEFPEEVEQEAADAAIRSVESEAGQRLDLRESVIFTIDPSDAKDFDDAVSIEKHDGGGWTVGVHIADVSHYVAEDTRLDSEAWDRGTSVYLVDRVISMLPHALSNDKCSLQPDADRLTFSCFIRLDPEGNTVETELADTVIRSCARLDYEQAQRIIETGSDPGASVSYAVVEALAEMARVAGLLARNRAGRGSIDFDLPEPIVVLDEKGFPVAVRERLRLASHRLIEEFMILANEAVAEYAHNLGLPFVYRIHEEPDPERIQEFAEFMRSLGYPAARRSTISPGMFNEFLQRVEGKKIESLVSKVMLRHMKQALYSVDNAGHFGLASRAYCHFTSPIRRYPDLIVHRMLRRYRSEVPTGPALERWEEWLRGTAEQASERERTAMEVERESIKMKQIAYMEKHIGDVFPGVISGVTGFGVFVELEDLLVDGLIHVSDLGNDYYLYEEKRYRLIGERTRQQFRLGDQIMVQVVRADRVMRELDFIPVPDSETAVSDTDMQGERT